jgi:tyrosyl-tRNA synthetase
LNASFEEQWSILCRGVEAITPEADLRRKLTRAIATNTPLRVKYGIDPTGIDVHLGHTVPLRKLRQFQDLGHTAVIIIGNYTALVGDPSGRDETRAQLTREQVEANAKDYLAQVGKIIDLGRAEVHPNGEWFSRWTFLDVLDLCRRMTIGQMTARDDFAKRIAAEKPVYLHECLYPLMQGWDSVEIRADVELGGSEQLFSLLVARDLQDAEGQEPQVAMTLPILVGTDGVRRMGKSLGNYIGVAESAEQQFGKVMSIPDEPMRRYFLLLTDSPIEEVDRLLGAGVNPRDAKESLAKAVVGQYHGEEAAANAANAFRRRAKSGPDLDNLRGFTPDPSDLNENDSIPPGKFLFRAGMAKSISEGSRLVEGGAVWLDNPTNRIPRDRKFPLHLKENMIVGMGTANTAIAVVVHLPKPRSEPVDPDAPASGRSSD